MSVAQNTLNVRGSSFRSDSTSKIEVATKIDSIQDKEESSGLDQTSSFRGNRNASKRVFLAQTPACARPNLTGATPVKAMSPAQLQEVLADSLAFLGKEGGESFTSNAAALQKFLPAIIGMLPAGQQKNELMGVAAALNHTKDAPAKDSGNLFDFLTALTMFQIATGKDQTNIALMNQSFSDAGIKMLQDASLKAAGSLNDMQTQEASRSTASFWTTLLSVGSIALGSVVFLVTGSPMLLAMAVIGTITSNVKTANGESLDQGLSDWVGTAALNIATEFCGGTPPAAMVTAFKDILFGAIAIAETLVLGGCESALESGSQDAVKVVNVAATETEMVGESVVKTSTEVTLKVTNSSARRAAGKLLMALSSNGPLLPAVCQQIAQAAFPNDKDAQTYVAMGLQLVLGLAGSLEGAKLNGNFNGPSLANMITSNVGENTYRWGMRTLKALETATNVGGAASEYVTGKILQNEETTLHEQADARLTMAASSGVIQSLAISADSSAQAHKGVYEGMASTMQSIARRLDPLDPRNYAN